MQWQLSGPWPVGASLIPGGTIITAVVGPDGELVFDHTIAPPLPINAVALDDEAALQMAMWFNEEDTINGWHQLHFAPGIDREAIFAKARHKKRWPNGEPAPAERPLKGASLSLPEEPPRRSNSRKRS
jgi:hypothetical protein